MTFPEVIKGMGLVADHINEMQRLCETYWPLIQTLSNDTKLYEVHIITYPAFFTISK